MPHLAQTFMPTDPTTTIQANADTYLQQLEADRKLGNWLEMKRRKAGLSQERLDRLTAQAGARISQSYLSQLERGQKPLSGLDGARARFLREFLKITPEEWIEATGLVILDTVENVAIAVQNQRKNIPTSAQRPLATLSIPHFGPLSNLTRVNYNSPMSQQKWPEHPSLSAYSAGDLFTLDMTAQALADDEVLALIPTGSRVLFLRTTRVEPGDLILVSSEQGDLLYQHGETYPVLRSHDRKQAPILVSQDMPRTVRGVYLTHMAPIRERKP